MNPTKCILVSAAIAGLIAGTAVKAQADHHEGEKAAAEKNKCKGHKEKAKAKNKAKTKGKKAKAEHKCGEANGCGGPNGCGGANGCGGKSDDGFSE